MWNKRTETIHIYLLRGYRTLLGISVCWTGSSFSHNFLRSESPKESIQINRRWVALLYMRFSFSMKSKGRDRTHYSRINGYAFPFHWDPFLCWDAQKETEDLFLILKIGYDDLDRHLPRAVIIGLLFIPGFVGQHPPCIILHVSHSTVCIQKLKMSLKKRKKKTF